ncbi:MAG: hypothetical protein ACPIGG_06430 [Akkermansiaceae bacterium]
MSALALVAGLAYVRFRKGCSNTYLFPKVNTPKRLGAERGAGVGAVIAFHSKLGSPSSQRNAMLDYLTKV